MATIYVDDPGSIEPILSAPWGTVVTNGQVSQLICPLCVAMIPASFTNAHELTETPQKRHADVHRAVAHALATLKNRA